MLKHIHHQISGLLTSQLKLIETYQPANRFPSIINSVPTLRLIIGNFLWRLLDLSDPAGRVAPKFPKSAKINSFDVSVETELSLLCDAQAFPAPVFRSVLEKFN